TARGTRPAAGTPLHQAKPALPSQPLSTTLVFRPAEARQRVGVVVKQFPASGHLSSGERVTLVLPRALHGVVPNVVGLTVDKARAKLAPLQGEVTVTPGDTPGSARIVAQSPRAGRAAAPGMAVPLAVK